MTRISKHSSIVFWLLIKDNGVLIRLVVWAVD